MGSRMTSTPPGEFQQRIHCRLGCRRIGPTAAWAQVHRPAIRGGLLSVCLLVMLYGTAELPAFARAEKALEFSKLTTIDPLSAVQEVKEPVSRAIKFPAPAMPESQPVASEASEASEGRVAVDEERVAKKIIHDMNIQALTGIFVIGTVWLLILIKDRVCGI